MNAVLDARGDQAHHALVPVVPIQAQGGPVGRAVGVEVLENAQRLAPHLVLDAAPRPVEVVEFGRHLAGRVGVAGQQAFDAQAHIVQAAGGIESGAGKKPQIGGGGPGWRAAGGFQKRQHAGLGLPGADALQALVDEDAVEVVERHDIRHGAERDQIQQLTELGFRQVHALEMAVLPQVLTQGHQDVKHDADTGQSPAGESLPGQIGVDDGVGGRKAGSGQMMVGDQHPHAQGPGGGNAFMTGDAVVDGQEHVGLARSGEFDDLRCQSVAIFEAVGHQIVDPAQAQRPQPLDGDGRGRGAVGVVVADDQQRAVVADGVGQAFDHGRHAGERVRSRQPAQGAIQLGRIGHVAAGIEPLQQGRQPGQFGRGGIDDATEDFLANGMKGHDGFVDPVRAERGRAG